MHIKRTFQKVVDGSCAHSVVEKTRISHGLLHVKFPSSMKTRWPLVCTPSQEVHSHSCATAHHPFRCAARAICGMSFWLWPLTCLHPKSNCFGRICEGGRFKGWWASTWGQLRVMDEGVRKANVSHFCHCRKPSSSFSSCQYMMLQRKKTKTWQTKQGNGMLWHHSHTYSPGNRFFPEYQLVCTLSQHSWLSSQMVQALPSPPLPPRPSGAIAHGVQGTEICFSHTVLSRLSCPPCPHVLLGSQVAGEP